MRYDTPCAQSCPTFCNSMGCRGSSLSMRFSRQAYWSGLTVPPPGGLPDPGIKPASPVSPSLQVGGSSDLRLSWSEHGNQPWSWMLCLRNPRMFPDPGPRRWARNPTGIPQPPVWWDRKGRAGRAQRAEHEACGLDHLTSNHSTIASSGEFLDFLRPHFILKKKKKKIGLIILPSHLCTFKLNTKIRHITLLSLKWSSVFWKMRKMARSP